MPTCQSCGLNNFQDLAFCERCGGELDPWAQSPASTAPRNFSTRSSAGDIEDRLALMQQHYYPAQRQDPQAWLVEEPDQLDDTLKHESPSSAQSLLQRLRSLTNYPASLAASSRADSIRDGLGHDSETASVMSYQVEVSGVVPRAVAETILRRHDPGCYLLRARSDGRMGLALSVRTKTAVAHYLIADNGKSSDFHLLSSVIKDMPRFSSLRRLVEHYMSHPVGEQVLIQPLDIVDFHHEIVSQFESTAAEVRRAVLHADDLIEVLSLQRLLQTADARNRLSPDDIEEFDESLEELRTRFGAGLPSDRWIPDSHTDTCQCCQVTQFGTLRRRHHCRNCGKLVAMCCVVGSVQAPGIQLEKVCRTCFERLKQLLPALETKHRSLLERRRTSSRQDDGVRTPSAGDDRRFSYHGFSSQGELLNQTPGGTRPLSLVDSQ
eukprot:TRINITY_DN11612_c0_g4_i2.p1 TRINITY_DN11612_c0_g4~~TRINITY_DN11612_c0_g4_i2.p1  ORF type:complete len:436 (+),score=83.23 TRINITY_DN11612_c0_g4_i2:223-1530(+)